MGRRTQVNNLAYTKWLSQFLIAIENQDRDNKHFPWCPIPSDLKHSSVCHSTNWTKSLYKSTVTEWGSWGKKPNCLQRSILGTLQRCILGTGLFQIQRESLEARKLHIVRLRIPISNASWLYASNVSNELIFFQPSTNHLVYNGHSCI